MKKFTIIFIISVVSLIISFCSPAKKTIAAKEVNSNYESGIAIIIAEKCAPCHIPAKGGFKKAFDNYASVKTDIDEIIKRIELNPTDKGFMPFKKTVRLNDSTINVFKKWRDDGLLEK